MGSGRAILLEPPSLASPRQGERGGGVGVASIPLVDLSESGRRNLVPSPSPPNSYKLPRHSQNEPHRLQRNRSDRAARARDDLIRSQQAKRVIKPALMPVRFAPI